MCWWQRYAHFAALPFALAAVLAGPRLKDGGRALVWLAALAIFVSGAIGCYHAGVELKLLPGFTQCTAALTGSANDMLNDVFARPLVRCDDVQWSWLGISMAGWNAIVSILGALSILWLSLRKPKTA
jgi:disulfide bond formation protein DsbB